MFDTLTCKNNIYWIIKIQNIMIPGYTFCFSFVLLCCKPCIFFWNRLETTWIIRFSPSDVQNPASFAVFLQLATRNKSNANLWNCFSRCEAKKQFMLSIKNTHRHCFDLFIKLPNVGWTHCLIFKSHPLSLSCYKKSFNNILNMRFSIIVVLRQSAILL